MLGGIVYRGATVILPAYFELKTPMLYQWLTGVTQGAFSQNLVATTITSVIFLIGVGGQFSGGQCADRYDPGISYLIFFGIAGLAAFWMAQAQDLMLVGLALAIGAAPFYLAAIAFSVAMDIVFCPYEERKALLEKAWSAASARNAAPKSGSAVISSRCSRCTTVLFSSSTMTPGENMPASGPSMICTP